MSATGSRTRRYLPLLLAGALLEGCPAPEATPEPAACADGSWAGITDPSQVVLVHADTSTPSQASAVFDDLQDAVDHASDPANKQTVVVSSGRWASSIRLEANASPPNNNITIEGCAPDESILVPGPGLLNEPLIDAWAVQGITIRNLGLEFGRNALTVRDGANVTAEDLHIEASSQTGVFVTGGATIANLLNVDIVGSVPEASGFGWGLAVEDVGLDLGIGLVTVNGGLIDGNSELGVYVNNSEVDMVDTVVSNTLSNGGRWGRGVHSQGGSEVELTRLQLQGNSDAAVFALDPDLLVTNDVVIIIVPAAELPDQGGPTGDGIVAARSDATNPLAHRVEITGGEYADLDRAGVVLRGVDAELTGVVTVGAVAGVPGAGTGRIVYGSDEAIVDRQGDYFDLYEELDAALVPVDEQSFSFTP